MKRQLAPEPETLETQPLQKKPKTSALPRYVVNIPYVASDESGDEVSDVERKSSATQNYIFLKNHFKKPHKYFRISSKKAKQNAIVALDENESIEDQKIPPPRMQKLIDLFNHESFGATETESRETAEKRLQLILGVNRMRSLSKRKNKKVKKLINTPLNAYFPVKKIGFLWEAQWQKMENGDWKNISFEEANEFYRRLKIKDKNRARNFRKKMEKPSYKNIKMGENPGAKRIPYREIREEIKKHTATKESIVNYRQKDPDAPVYFGVMDSDIVSLRNETGVFSHYDRMIKQHKEKYKVDLEVGSVGYKLPKYYSDKSGVVHDNSINRLSSEMDLWVRYATALVFPHGIYYPEPTTIIKIPDEIDYIDASFAAENPTDNRNEMQYFIEDLIKKRRINPRISFAFDNQGAVEILPSDRMKIPYNAHFNTFEKIVRWTRHQLGKMRQMSQSHAETFSWAKKVYPALYSKEENSFNIDGKEFKLNSKVAGNMIISILTRIYNHYDPISIAESIWENSPENGYPKELIEVLKNYQPEPLLLKPVKKKRTSKNEHVLKIWKRIDKIDNLSELTKMLENFIDPNDVKNICEVARNIGKKNVELLEKNLSMEFEELSIQLITDYFKSLGTKVDNAIVLNKALKALLFSNETPNKRTETGNTKALLQKINKTKFKFGTHVIHWAAITGNRYLITKIIENDGKNVLNVEAQFNVLPLHLGIQYCADNGNDIELIKMLVTDHSINKRTTDGKTPFLSIITELEDPIPVLEALNNYQFLPDDLMKLLKEVIKKTKFDDRRNILIAILLHLNQSKERTRLIVALIKQGANCLELCNPIEEIPVDFPYSGYFEDTPSYQTCAFLEAIAQRDIKLINALLNMDINLKNVRDSSGRSAIWIAVEQLAPKVCISLLPFLAKKGANPNQGIDDRTTPMHELISPRYMEIENEDQSQVKSNKKILKVLLKKFNKIDLGFENNNRDTILDLALAHDNNDAIELIMKYIAKEIGSANLRLDPDEERGCFLLQKQYKTDPECLNAYSCIAKLSSAETERIRDLTGYDVLNDDEYRDLEYEFEEYSYDRERDMFNTNVTTSDTEDETDDDEDSDSETEDSSDADDEHSESESESKDISDDDEDSDDESKKHTTFPNPPIEHEARPN